MSEAPSIWQTDNRWRRVQVSSKLLSDILAAGIPAGVTSDAPSDLRIVGLYEVNPGPGGWFTFVVWSASFDPLPMNDEGRLLDEIPLVKFEYRR